MKSLASWPEWHSKTSRIDRMARIGARVAGKSAIQDAVEGGVLLAVEEAMDHKTIEEVKRLVRDFERQTLPLTAWNHRTQLTICCWYALNGERAEYLMRQGIQRFLKKHGTLTTTRRYHETLTVFWVAKVQALVEVCSGTDLAVINAVIRGLADKDLVLFHYTRERIMSKTARRNWCEPDLRRLPRAAHDSCSGAQLALTA